MYYKNRILDEAEWDEDIYENSNNLFDYLNTLFSSPTFDDIYEYITKYNIIPLIKSDPKQFYSFEPYKNREFDTFVRNLRSVFYYPQYSSILNYRPSLINGKFTLLNFHFNTEAYVGYKLSQQYPIIYNFLNASIIFSNQLFKYILSINDGSIVSQVDETDVEEMVITAYLSRNLEVIHILEQKFSFSYDDLFPRLAINLICSIIKCISYYVYVPSMRVEISPILTNYVDLFDYLMRNLGESDVEESLTTNLAPLDYYDDVNVMIEDYSKELVKVMNLIKSGIRGNILPILFESVNTIYAFAIINNDSFKLIDTLIMTLDSYGRRFDTDSIISSATFSAIFASMIHSSRNVIPTVIESDGIVKFFYNNPSFLTNLVVRYKLIGLPYEKIKKLVIKMIERKILTPSSESELLKYVSMDPSFQSDIDIRIMVRDELRSILSKLKFSLWNMSFSEKIYILNNIMENNMPTCELVKGVAQKILNEMTHNDVKSEYDGVDGIDGVDINKFLKGG